MVFLSKGLIFRFHVSFLGGVSLELKNLHNIFITQMSLWELGRIQYKIFIWWGLGRFHLPYLRLEHPKMSKQKIICHTFVVNICSWGHSGEYLVGPWLVPRNAAKKLAMLGDTVPWWRFVGGFGWSLLVEGEGKTCRDSMQYSSDQFTPA